jgi:hypothetical protein
MRKLISFTLYGEDPKYIEGMYRNLDLREEFYPSWETIIYHDNSLSAVTLMSLLGKGATLRNVEGCGVLASMWRFLAHDEPDTERFIVRDSDSRLSQREADAVQQWVANDHILHIMRDHPHHGYAMNGGMWGMKPDPDIRLAELCLHYQKEHSSQATVRDNWWMKDMQFLRDVIYPLAHPQTCTIHAATDYMGKVAWKNESWAQDFPTPRNEDRNFVGEQIDIVDGKEQRAYQYTELP